MKTIPLLVLMLAADCLARPGPATTAKVYVKGFPDARVAPFEGSSWPGTARCFQGDDGKLFYFEIMFDRSYDTYCTAQFENAGINDFRIELGRMSYVQQKKEPGFQPHPDHIDLSFILHYKTQPAQRPIGFTYELPESSQTLGHTAGFSKLQRNQQIALTVESVTSDMKSIARQLVQRLRNGPITVGSLTIRNTNAVSQPVTGNPSANEYKIGLVNKTGQNLYGLSVSYDDKEVCAIPDVVAQVKVGYSEMLTLKRPAEAVVRWQQSVGLPWPETTTKHRVIIKLDGSVATGFSRGTVFFVIRNDDMVEVRPIKWGDEKASANLMREK